MMEKQKGKEWVVMAYPSREIIATFSDTNQLSAEAAAKDYAKHLNNLSKQNNIELCNTSVQKSYEDAARLLNYLKLLKAKLQHNDFKPEVSVEENHEKIFSILHSLEENIKTIPNSDRIEEALSHAKLVAHAKLVGTPLIEGGDGHDGAVNAEW